MAHNLRCCLPDAGISVQRCHSGNLADKKLAAASKGVELRKDGQAGSNCLVHPGCDDRSRERVALKTFWNAVSPRPTNASESPKFAKGRISNEQSQKLRPYS